MKNRILSISLVVILALSVGLIGCKGEEVPEIPKYNLTISSTEGGLVTNPGQGTFTYDEGTVVELVAETDEGCQFARWTGDTDSVADIHATSTTITMNGHYAITANFIGTYNVQAIYSASGGMFQIHSGDIDGDGLPEASILCNIDDSFFVDYKDGAYAVSLVLHSGAGVFGDVADTDGDGLAEIIAGATPNVKIVSYMAPNIFQIDATIPIDGSARGVIAGDIRNDGSMRIIVGSHDSGYVHVFKYYDGNYVEEWSDVVVPNSEIIPTAAGDVDNDGQTEFLINVWETPGYGPSNGNIYVYKWTGETYEPVLVQHTNARGGMGAAIVDIDRDGKNELIIDTGLVSVYKYSSQADRFEHIWSAPDGDLLQIAIGDVDVDGQDEAVCFFPWSTPGKIIVIGYDGTEYNVEATITDFPDGLGGGTVTDFDGDGQDEIITSLFNVGAPEYPIFLVKYAPPPA